MSKTFENFKCGLEIHQRLDTRKLFSHVYANPNKEITETTIQVIRLIGKAAGESGKTDESAKFEASKKQTFTYVAGNKTSSLVEIDEEPPHELSKQALSVVLQVAQATGAHVLPVIQVMRKTIVDGSTTSGFQRTMLVAIGGKIDTPSGPVRIQTICLEEESCGIIEKTKGHSTYSLDRLGIPLIEIATEPDVISPKHARETALAIGELLRATGKVQRGIGTIRQDLNVSIQGGTRCEVKGAQDLDAIEKLVENEANRQLHLIEIRSKIKTPTKPHIENLTSIFANTNCKFIAKALATGAKLYGVKLPDMKNILGYELAPNYRVGSEISDFVKANCNDGILHADEDLPKYSISQQEITEVKLALQVKEHDSYILTVSNQPQHALELALKRLNQLSHEIPADTRRADGEISRFMRPISGAARLYPETDCQLIKITSAELKNVKTIETLDEKIKRYEKYGLGIQLAQRMAKDAQNNLFEELSKTTDPQTVAITLLETITTLKRSGKNTTNLNTQRLSEALNAYAHGEVNKQALAVLLEKMCESNHSTQELIHLNNLKKFKKEEIKKAAKELNNDISKIMQKYRLNIDATLLQEAIKELKP